MQEFQNYCFLIFGSDQVRFVTTRKLLRMYRKSISSFKFRLKLGPLFVFSKMKVKGKGSQIISKIVTSL